MWLQLISGSVNMFIVSSYTALHNILTCLLVALCLAIISLICLTSALVIPPMTNNIMQSLEAGRGRAELINKLFINT